MRSVYKNFKLKVELKHKLREKKIVKYVTRKHEQNYLHKETFNCVPF